MLRRPLSLLGVLALLGGMGLAPASVRAELTLTLGAPVQTGTAGATLTFTGTLTNNGTETVFLNGSESDLPGPELTLDDTPFATGAPLSLAPSAQYTGPLFTVHLGNALASGTFPGSFRLKGGATTQTGDDLVSVSFTVVVAGSSVASLSGTVTLEACEGIVETLLFELRPRNGDPAFQMLMGIEADGSFLLPDLPAQDYDLWIKGSQWLAQVVSADATLGDVSGITVTLPGGDANDDNHVDIFDLATLAESFNTVLGEETYNPRTDFNCDASVDIFDLALLAENFNTDGDF